MLEMGARFSNDLYLKVSFDPDQEAGVVTLIRSADGEIYESTAEYILNDK